MDRPWIVLAVKPLDGVDWEGIRKNMKQRTIITAALSVVISTAAACPIKAGYIANGQFKDTTGLTPLCGPSFNQLASGIVKPHEYGEIYETTKDAAGSKKIGKAVSLLQTKGWRPDGIINNKSGKNYTFIKGMKQIVMLVQQESTSVMIVLIGDK